MGASEPKAPAGRDLQIPVAEIPRLLGLALEPGPAHARLLRKYTAGETSGAHEAIGLADYFRLLRELAASDGDETFAMSSRPMAAGTAEFVLSGAVLGATAGEGLRRLAHGYNILHGAGYNLVEQRGPNLCFAIDDARFPYTRARDDYLHFSLECALIFVHAVVCELTSQDLGRAVKRVATKREEGSERVRQPLAFWDAPIVHGAAAYSIAYEAWVADLPLVRPPGAPPASVAVHNRILTLIEAKQAGARAGRPVAASVRRALEDGLKDQGEVARSLGLSLATLRRRLSEEGETFRGLRHQVLNRLAQTRLQTDKDIAQVAEDLGFSDRRSFTRAFKGWNGVTPNSYRRREGPGFSGKA